MSDVITITLTKAEAESLSHQISDWMCWTAGVEWGSRAAAEWDRPFIPDRHRLQELNIKLKDELNRSEKQ